MINSELVKQKVTANTLFYKNASLKEKVQYIKMFLCLWDCQPQKTPRKSPAFSTNYYIHHTLNLL